MEENIIQTNKHRLNPCQYHTFHPSCSFLYFLIGEVYQEEFLSILPQCRPNCGQVSYKSRYLVCQWSDTKELAWNACDPRRKPETFKPCKPKPCSQGRCDLREGGKIEKEGRDKKKKKKKMMVMKIKKKISRNLMITSS